MNLVKILKQSSELELNLWKGVSVFALLINNNYKL